MNNDSKENIIIIFIIIILFVIVFDKCKKCGNQNKSQENFSFRYFNENNYPKFEGRRVTQKPLPCQKCSECNEDLSIPSENLEEYNNLGRCNDRLSNYDDTCHRRKELLKERLWVYHTGENLTNYQYASCGLQLKELYISNQIKRVDGFLYSDTSNISNIDYKIMNQLNLQGWSRQYLDEVPRESRVEVISFENGAYLNSLGESFVSGINSLKYLSLPRIDEIRWSRIRDLHLEELYLADNIKVIHSGAFQDCTVKKLRLPHRGLQEIRRNAFDGHNSSMRGTRYTGPKLQQISGSHYSIKQLFDSGSYIQNNGSELLKNNIYIKNNDTYTIKYLNNKWHIAPLSSFDNRLRKISFKFLVDDIHYLIHTNDRNVPPDYYYPNNKAPNFELRPTGRHKWANRIIYDRSKNMIVKFMKKKFFW